MGTVFRIQNQKKEYWLAFVWIKRTFVRSQRVPKKIGISRNEWIVQAIEYAINSMEQEENVGKTEK